MRGEQEVGRVTSAAVTPRLGAIALAYLKRGHDGTNAELTVGGRAARVRR